MGHTEGAAGVAGLIKVALALRNREIPASLHFETPNPAIPWDTLPLVIRPEATPWPIDADLIGGVSSFGIAGTNAHLVLEAAPAAAASRENGQANRPRAYLLPLSARTPGALADQARRFANFLEASSEDPALEDVCYTAATRRAHHEHRLGVVGRTRDEVIAGLEGYVRGEQGTGTKIGQAETERRPRVVFVFPGQGSQWLGMGRQLLAEEPVFRASIEACERAMAAEVDWSLVEQLSAEADVSRMGEIDVIQPSLFAIQVSLAALWRSRGVEPDAVVGHSMGETAAAHVAGVLSLDDAVKVICRRSRLLRRISGQGAMAVVDLPLDAAGQELIGYEDRLAVAVSNSPRSTVLSGDPAALDAVLAGLEQRNIFCRRVKVDVASHSPQVDPLRDDLLAALADLQPRHATVPFYSTVTGEQTAGDGCDATYWMRNLRQPVLFSTVVSLLLDAEHDTFIEMSPHPILLQAVEGTAAVNGRPVHALGSGQREADEPAVLLSSLGALYTRGYPVNWQALYSDGGSVTRLPTYAWQTERYWLDMGTPRAGDGAGQLDHHPLLGMRLPDLAHAPGHTVWQRSLDGGFLRKLTGGPPVDEMTTLPDAPIQSLALAAAIERFGDRPHAVANLEMHEPLLLDTDAGRTLQFVLTSDTRGAATFRAYSRGGPDEAWTCHATAALALERANADWLYSLTWRRQPHLSISGNGHATAAGYWLVFADQGSIGENVAAQLTQHGDSVVRVRPGSGFSIAGGTDLPTVTLDPNRRASYDQLFANLAATRGTNCRGVLYLWGLDLPAADHLTSAALGARVDEANRRALFLIQALADARWPTAPRCWVVTRGAQAPEVESDGPPPVAIAQTPLWGLGRVAALEHPEIWGGLIDLATSPTQNEVADLLVELTDPDGEDQIALRGGERFVARLIRTPGLERPKPTAASVSPDATYLVTGGLGDIGLHVAHWLVDQGARHLVLTGRSGLPDREMWGSVEADSTVGRRIAAVRALEERGVTVITPRVDTSDAEGMATLLASLRAGPWPLRGIFHAAGVLSNQAIVDLTPDALSDILRPKVDGAWLLHELTSDPGHPDALDFFVMFSSGAALWGSRGLAHYAAANAFLDGLAHERHTRGLPALSVNWGWWLGNGIAAGELADAFSAVGLDPMPADDALAALSYLLRVGAVQQSVAQIDWTRFRPVYESRRESPLLREIEAAPRAAGTGTDAPSQRSALLEQIERALPIERLTLITSHVRQSVAQVLGFGPDEPLDPRQGFFKLGMDSIMTVQLRSLLEGSLGQSLPATVAFEYPTVESLAAYLDREVLAAAAPSSGEPAAGAAAVEEFTIEESTDAFDDLSEAELLAAFDREFGSIGQDDPVTR
jgi:acyl transferase domain-containing protein/acyl carrier protein